MKQKQNLKDEEDHTDKSVGIRKNYMIKDIIKVYDNKIESIKNRILSENIKKNSFPHYILQYMIQVEESLKHRAIKKAHKINNLDPWECNCPYCVEFSKQMDMRSKGIIDENYWGHE